MDANAAKPSRKRNRRWFQFRLRTLFAVVTAWAILCPFGMSAYRKWEAERKQAEAHERLRLIGIAMQAFHGDSRRPFPPAITHP